MYIGEGDVALRRGARRRSMKTACLRGDANAVAALCAVEGPRARVRERARAAAARA